MSAKIYRLLTIFIILFGAIATGTIGLSLLTRYLRTQQNIELQQANNLLTQQKYAPALAAYDRLLKRKKVEKPENDELLTNRGYALLGLNQYPPALESCTQATSIEPTAALAWNCRGEALYYLDRPQDALAAFQQAIALDDNNPTWQLNLGRVLQSLERYESAAASLSKAIAKLESANLNSPKSEKLANAYNDLGQSLLSLGQDRQALQAFEKALRDQGDSFAPHQGKGIALYRLGKHNRAIKTFERILHRTDLTSEQQAINWLYHGISLCQTSKRTNASKSFESVLKLTQNPELRKIAQAGCGIR